MTAPRESRAGELGRFAALAMPLSLVLLCATLPGGEALRNALVITDTHDYAVVSATVIGVSGPPTFQPGTCTWTYAPHGDCIVDDDPTTTQALAWNPANTGTCNAAPSGSAASALFGVFAATPPNDPEVHLRLQNTAPAGASQVCLYLDILNADSTVTPVGSVHLSGSMQDVFFNVSDSHGARQLRAWPYYETGATGLVNLTFATVEILTPGTGEFPHAGPHVSLWGQYPSEGPRFSLWRDTHGGDGYNHVSETNLLLVATSASSGNLTVQFQATSARPASGADAPFLSVTVPYTINVGLVGSSFDVLINWTTPAISTLGVVPLGTPSWTGNASATPFPTDEVWLAVNSTSNNTVIRTWRGVTDNPLDGRDAYRLTNTHVAREVLVSPTGYPSLTRYLGPAGPGELLPPTNLTATPLNNSVNLSWTAALNATRYNVYVNSTLVGTTAGTHVHIANLTGAVTYTFRVTSVNGANESAPATVTATPLVPCVSGGGSGSGTGSGTGGPASLREQVNAMALLVVAGLLLFLALLLLLFFVTLGERLFRAGR